MENNFTDKHTEDKAWERMRSTLDKEMPVKKKRRVLFWTPIFVGFAIMVSTYFFWFQKNESPINKNEIIATAKTQELVETKVEKHNNNSNHEVTSNQLNKEKKINDIEISSTAKLTKRSNNKTNIKATAPLKTIVNKRAINEFERPSKSKLNAKDSMNYNVITEAIKENLVKTIQTPKVENEVPKLETQKAKSKNVKISDSEIIDKREALSIASRLPSQPNPMLEWTDVIPEMQKIVLPKKQQWNIAIHFGYLSNFKFDATLLQPEMQLVRKLSSKWSILSGIGLKSYTHQAQFSSLAVETDTNMNFDPALASNMLNLSGEKNNFEFLYLPLATRYHLKGRWIFEAGAHYNFRNSLQDSKNHFSFYIAPQILATKKLSFSLRYQADGQRFKSRSNILGSHHIGIGARYQF